MLEFPAAIALKFPPSHGLVRHFTHTTTIAMNPADPQSSAPKKGLSGLAIAGIGCGGLVLIAAAGGMMLMGKACSKVKEVAGDMQKNPARAAVMMGLKMNPDIEIIKTDDARNEVTFKEKKSGKVTTMSFDELAQGKFKINTDGKEVTIDGSGLSKEGKMTMKDEKGNEVTLNGGGGDGTLVHTQGPDGEITFGGVTTAPEWVPAYPGAKPLAGGMTVEKAGESSGTAISEVADPVAKVKEFYETKLKEAGYKVESTTISSGGKDTIMISSSKDDGKTSVNAVVAVEEGKTRLTVNYQIKK